MALPTGSPVTLELRRRRGDGAAKIIHDVADGCARCVDLHVAGAVLVAARLAGFTALPWAVAALPFFAATGAAFAAQVRFLRTAAQLRLWRSEKSSAVGGVSPNAVVFVTGPLRPWQLTFEATTHVPVMA